MPKVVSLTPEWLSRPNPGYELFRPAHTSTNTATNGLGSRSAPEKPRKAIATRGTEIFTAVGNEIRWADLARIKEDFEEILPVSQKKRPTANGSEKHGVYRTLKPRIHGPISQLVISPNGDYMAIATSHTIHVALLPSYSLFDSGKNALDLKTFQLGPTAHVLENAPISSILWHPLGYHGRCLVTVTADAVIRLWELNRSDRTTFSEPALSVDLKKLANATSVDDDLGASAYGASVGFSPDSIELEVASACFGDYPEQEDVHGWAPMTLWVAMVEGDVYALCPFLPSKWQLERSNTATSFMQTLSTTINANYASIQDDENASPEEQETSEKQLSWLSDLIYQQPIEERRTTGETVDVYTRPQSTPTCPLLQGPFSLVPEWTQDVELSDMVVYTMKTFAEVTDGGLVEGLPAAVICLLTTSCQVHICLDFEGVVARWLPSTQDQTSLPESPEHPLVLAETIELVDSASILPSPDQAITPDVHSDYSFFVTHRCGVFYISLESWIWQLEIELCQPQTEGAEFRSKLLFESARTLVECPLPIQQDLRNATRTTTSSVVIADGNIGYLLLTVVADQPYAAILDAHEDDKMFQPDELSKSFMAASKQFTQGVEIRAPYQPPRELYAPSNLQGHLDRYIPHRQKALLKEEVRLSPFNLGVLMEAHRTLSQETSELGLAVADLFRRCERLRDEFRTQIQRTAQLAEKVDSATALPEGPGVGELNGKSTGGSDVMEKRLDQARNRQALLMAQYDRIRRKLGGLDGRIISEKEGYWIEEVEVMNRALAKPVSSEQQDSTTERIEKLKRFKQELDAQVQGLSREMQGAQGSGTVKVPSGSRKQENEEVKRLLDRETMLVEAAVERLRKLGISIPAGVKADAIESD